MYVLYIYIYIYIDIYIRSICRQQLFCSLKAHQYSSPECSNYCQSCEHCISLVATLLDQQSAQLNKAKERNIVLYINR